MENPRPEKVAVVEEVRERLSSSPAVILTEYRGMRVSELAELRRALRRVGAEYTIYKNRLVRLAVGELGLDGVEELLTGPTAIAFAGGDVVEVASTLRDCARATPALVVKGGLLGERLLTAGEARALADIPPRPVLLARLAGGLAAPLSQLAGLLSALPRNLAYGLRALVDQGGASAGPAPPTAADTSTQAAPAAGPDTPEEAT
ncbi:MAG: 50S ribosomal protein L10 [Acidimicrobiales bacterium]